MISNKLLISIFEGIYIIYMFNFFKTKKNIAHPLSYFDNPILYHPIENSDKPQNMICPLGNYGSYLIGIYLIGRNFMKLKKNILRQINNYILIFILLATLMNFNATLYFMPILIIEYFMI